MEKKVYYPQIMSVNSATRDGTLTYYQLEKGTIVQYNEGIVETPQGLFFVRASFPKAEMFPYKPRWIQVRQAVDKYQVELALNFPDEIGLVSYPGKKKPSEMYFPLRENPLSDCSVFKGKVFPKQGPKTYVLETLEDYIFIFTHPAIKGNHPLSDLAEINSTTNIENIYEIISRTGYKLTFKKKPKSRPDELLLNTF